MISGVVPLVIKLLFKCIIRSYLSVITILRGGLQLYLKKGLHTCVNGLVIVLNFT